MNSPQAEDYKTACADIVSKLNDVSEEKIIKQCKKFSVDKIMKAHFDELISNRYEPLKEMELTSMNDYDETETLKSIVNRVVKRNMKCASLKLDKNSGNPKVYGSCGNKPIKVFLDSGSEVTLIKKQMSNKIPVEYKYNSSVPNVHLTGVTGQTLPTEGFVFVKLRLARSNLWLPCLIVSDQNSFDGDILLGNDVLKSENLVLDFANNKLIFPNEKKVKIHYGKVEEDEVLRHDKKAITACGNQLLKARSVSLLTYRIKGKINDLRYFCPNEKLHDVCKESLINIDKNLKGVMPVYNFSNVDIAVRDYENLGQVMPVDPVVELSVNNVQSKVSNNKLESVNSIRSRIDAELECEPEYRHTMLNFLTQYRKIIALPGDPLLLANVPPVEIKLKEGAVPKLQPAYKIPHAHEAIVDREVKKLLDNKVVEPASSPWSSPIILLKKKDSEDRRLVVDLRYINSCTTDEYMNFPMPNINDIITKLGAARYFTSIDLKSAYWQIGLKPESRDLMCFRTTNQILRFTRMVQGFKSSTGNFQNIINYIFSPDVTKINDPISSCVLTYLDDILIHSRTVDEHLIHLKCVFERLLKFNFQVSIKKCKFF